MPGAFGRVGGEHVARVQHQSDLEDPERDEEQQRADEHELHDRSARLVADAPRSRQREWARHQPVIELMAWVKASVSFGPAIASSAATRAAVITVTKTQPGTSPVSSERGEAADALRSEQGERSMERSSGLGGRDSVRDESQ